MRFLNQSLLLTATMLLSSISMAGADEVPAANVPNPPNETGALLSIWTQFVVGDMPTSTAPAIEARFVLMGEQSKCDSVTVQGIAANAKVQSRGLLQGNHRRTLFFFFVTMKRGIPYKVRVCSALLDNNATDVSLTRDGKVLTVYPDDAEAKVPGPKRLGNADGTGKTVSGIVMGDTGCRGEEYKFGSRMYQDCKLTDIDSGKPYGWPFKALADKSAGMNPDFVIHLGDYHYFWEDSDFWSQDGGRERFEYWLQEFLLPARGLLRAAPWALSRGNHEICDPVKWFGDGWYTLFGPDEATCSAPTLASWYFDVAPADGNTKPYRFVMIDTANVWNINQAVSEAMSLAPTPGHAVSWATHYPPLKMVYYSMTPHFGDSQVMSKVNDAMNKCLTQACQPEAVFAGHQHLYQQITSQDGNGRKLPRVVIVGNSGTALDKSNLPVGKAGPNSQYANSVTCDQDFSVRSVEAFGVKDATGVIKTANRHGFVRLSRDANSGGDFGWTEEQVWAGKTAPVFAVADVSCLGN